MGFLSVISLAHRLAAERVRPGDTAIDATVGNGVDTLFLAKAGGRRGVVYGFDIQQAALDRTRERLQREAEQPHADAAGAEPAAAASSAEPGGAAAGTEPGCVDAGIESGGAGTAGSTAQPVRSARPDPCPAPRRRHEVSGLAAVHLLLRSHADMTACIPSDRHGQIAAVMFNLGYLPGADTAVVTRPDSTLAAVDAALSLLRPGGLVTIVVYPGHAGGSEEAAAVEGWAEALEPDRYNVLRYAFLNRRSQPPYLLAVEKR